MREIDKTKIIDKLETIYKSLEKLKELSKLYEEDFLSDFKYYDSAKYNFIQCIKAIIDISNHIIARKKLGNPKTYSEAFEILGLNDIISKEYINLVHLYAEINYRILKENLQDIEIFIKSIEKLLT